MLMLVKLATAQLRLAAAQTARRLALASGLVLLALLFAAIGLAGFLAALWIWLAAKLGAVIAALIIGGAGFALAALLLLLASLIARAPERPVSPAAEQLLAQLKTAPGAAALLPLLGAALLGFALGGKRR